MSPWLFLVCANKFCASWNRVSLVHLYILWEPDVKFSTARLFFSTNLIALNFVFLPLLLATRAAIWLRRILTKPESEGTILKIWVHLNPHVTPNCRCLMTICLPGGRETARRPWTPELAWPELRVFAERSWTQLFHPYNTPQADNMSRLFLVSWPP